MLDAPITRWVVGMMWWVTLTKCSLLVHTSGRQCSPTWIAWKRCLGSVA